MADMGFLIRQWLLPWRASPWQSLFHFVALVVSLALALLAVQVGLRAHFDLPGGVKPQPGLVTVGADVEQASGMGIPLLLAEELMQQPMWQWVQPVRFSMKLQPDWYEHDDADPSVTYLAGRDLFRQLGLKPALGRWFSRDPDQSAHEAVISYRMWKTRMSGRQDVLQQVLQQGNQTWQVVGVLPPSFQGFGTQGVDIWLSMDVLQLPPPDSQEPMAELLWKLENRIPDTHLLGRLRPGVNLAQLNRHLQPYRQWQAPPVMIHGEPVKLMSNALMGVPVAWSGLLTRPSVAQRLRQLSQLMLGIAFSLLLLVVAGLLLFLLENLPERLREFRLRYSMGASPAHILRQLAMENTLFFLPAVPLAWGLLLLLFHLLSTIEPFSKMIPDRIQPPDGGLLALGILGLLLVAWLLAALPARWLGHRLMVNQRHATRDRSWVWLGWSLNTIQLSAAFLAVLLALLFSGGVMRITATGWVEANRQVKLISWRCAERDEICKSLDATHIAQELKGDQQYKQALVTDMKPLGPSMVMPNTFIPVDQAENKRDIQVHIADPDLFALPGMPTVLAGTLPVAGSQHEVVLNRSAAKSLGWKPETAIGKLLQVANHARTYQVAVVVENANLFDPRVPAAAMVWFTPAYLQDRSWMKPLTVLWWLGPEPVSVIRVRMQDVLARMGMEHISVQVETLHNRAESLFRDDLRFARIVLLVAAFTLLLALLGVYASVLFVMRRDRRALGIHMAFGATPARLMHLALMPYVWIGLISLLLAAAMTGLLADWLNTWLLVLQDRLPWLLSLAVLGLMTMLFVSLLAGALVLVRAQPRSLLQGVDGSA